MKTQWNIDELEAHFTLLPPEIEWLDVKAKAYNRLAQAVMLKYFQQEGRFPEESRDVPTTVLDFIAQQLEIDPTTVRQYKWDGRTARDYKRAIPPHNIFSRDCCAKRLLKRFYSCKLVV